MRHSLAIHIRQIFLILLFAVVSGNSAVYAQSKNSSQLKKDKQRIENEIAQTQKLLKKTEKNQKASLQQIAVLRKQIDNREKLIAALNQEILQMEEQQALNQELIRSLQKKLEYMKADYAQVVYMAYRNRKLMDKVTFILASEDFAQMFRRIRFYTVFSHNVRQQADKIYQTQDELKRKNDEIIALKEEKLRLLSGKEDEVKQLEIDRRKKTQNAAQLKKQSQQLSSQLKAKQKKRKELDAAIKRAIEAEISKANAKNTKSSTAKKGSSGSSSPAGKSSGSSPASRATTALVLTPDEKALNNSFVSNKGKLPWPVVKGAKISDFGNYPHPDVPSVMVENRGIDILAESGTDVRAVFEGEVTGIMDIMGTKVVMIRHGEYISVYQNLASVNVKKGQKVSTRQTIGKVAHNSSSDTYELHFEIWKNNNYLNPNDWLARR